METGSKLDKDSFGVGPKVSIIVLRVWRLESLTV